MANSFFLYARKSEESEERQILSIEAQITELRDFAVKEKLHIKEIFIEAMTAKKPGRTKFNQMISQIEKGEAQGIIAWHPDRLARNSVDGGRIIYLLDTGHIKALKFPTFWFEATPQGKFMLNIAFGQSKYYVDNLSENVKRGNRQKLRNGGWPQNAPIGYINNRADKTLFVDPVRGPIIAKLFETYATGNHTLYDIVAVAAKMGLVSRLKSKRLPISTIQHIFNNPFYYGLMRYAGEYYQGKHEPLITKELFDKVQEVLRKRGKNHEVRKHHFSFLNLAMCPCGCSITGERQKGHNYYRCSKKKGPCKEPYAREESLDEQITDAIQEVALPEEGYQKMLAHLEQDKLKASQRLQQERESLQRPLQETKEKLERLLDLHLNGVISQQEYIGKKENLLTRKMDIEEKIKKLEKGGNLWLEPMEEFLKAAHHANQAATDKNLAAKRELLKKIGSNFRLTSRTLQFSYSFPWSFLQKSRPITSWCEGGDSNS